MSKEKKGCAGCEVCREVQSGPVRLDILALIYLGPIAVFLAGYFLGAWISEGLGIFCALSAAAVYLLILRRIVR